MAGNGPEPRPLAAMLGWAGPRVGLRLRIGGWGMTPVADAGERDLWSNGFSGKLANKSLSSLNVTLILHFNSRHNTIGTEVFNIWAQLHKSNQ